MKTNILLLFLLYLLSCASCKKHQVVEKNWRTILSDSLTTAEQKANACIVAADISRDSIISRQQLITDSFIMLGKQYAQESANSETILLAELNALRNTNWSANANEPKEIISNAQSKLSTHPPKALARTICRSLIAYFLQLGNNDEALSVVERMAQDGGENASIKIETHLWRARVFEAKNQPHSQLKELLIALYLSDESHSDSFKTVALGGLSDFYFTQKKYSTARTYNLFQRDTILHAKVVDSVAFFWCEYNRLTILNQLDPTAVNEKLAISIYQFAQRKNIESLAFLSQSQLRTIYLNAHKYEAIADWYLTRHVSELGILKAHHPDLYLKVMANIQEGLHNYDSARFYFNKSEQQISGNHYYAANFYERLGEFETRRAQPQTAAASYQKALVNYLQTNDHQMQLSIANRLLDYQNGAKSAAAFELLNTIDSIQRMLLQDESNERLKDVEMEKVLKDKEVEQTKKEEDTRRKHGIQIQILTLVVVLVFMTLVFLARSRVPQWWIRGMGYISFIMIFEFIIFLLDTWLHHKTHGEPFKIFLIKVIIISFLLPFHHWVEHRMVHFLMKYDILKESKKMAMLHWSKFWTRVASKNTEP